MKKNPLVPILGGGVIAALVLGVMAVIVLVDAGLLHLLGVRCDSFGWLVLYVLVEAVLGLPPNYRLAIYLHCVEGYAADEIAVMVHRRPNTVYSWLHRGRALLRQTLEGGTTDA